MRRATKPSKQTVQFASTAKFAIEWDVARDAPHLLKELVRRRKWVSGFLQQIRHKFPYATACGSFRGSQFVRLLGHRRAFYRLGPNGAVAIKGTEVLASDLRTHLLKEREAHDTLKRSLLEVFPLVEQKVPWTLLLEEALEEAERAAEIQGRHMARYSELAALPIPLLVIRWHDDVKDSLASTLLPMLSGRARKIVARSLSGGIGAYAYCYRNPPLRVQHVGSSIPSARRGYRPRLDILNERTNVEGVISEWIKLVARLFVLGYVPCTLTNLEIGQAIQSQNAVLDGGFVDLDSVTSIESFRTERDFFEAMTFTMAVLADTIRVFMLGVDLIQPVDPLIAQFVDREIRKAILEEQESGAKLHPLFIAYFGSDFASLDRVLAEVLPIQSKHEEGFG